MPLFSTPTPRIVDTTCPDHIEAWGTVTPNPGWALECYKCLPTAELPRTPEATVNATLFPTLAAQQTLQATGAVTPTVSTPVPTSAPGLYIDLMAVLGNSWGGPYGGGFTMYYDKEWGTMQTYADTIALVFRSTSSGLAHHWEQSFGGGDLMGGIIGETGWYWVYDSALIQQKGLSVAQVSSFIQQQLSMPVGTASQAWLSTPMLHSINNTIWTFESSQPPANLESRYWAVGFGGSHLATPTPTATPDPSWASICRAVNGNGEEMPDSFELPVPMVGPSECAQFGGWSIGLSWVSNIASMVGVNVPDSYQFPGFILCQRLIQFGVLDILDMEIDLDDLAYWLAAIYGVRTVIRMSGA